MPITATSGALSFFKFGAPTKPGSGEWITTVFPSQSGQISAGGDGSGSITNYANAGGYTIEYWINYSKVTMPNNFFLAVGAINRGFANNWYLYVDTSRRVRFSTTGAPLSTPINTISLGSWHNIALSCSNSAGTTTIRLFVDGILQATGTTTFNPIATYTPFDISTVNNTFLEQSALIDELRISNITRYTSNYAVATSEFTPDANTMALLHFSLNGTSSLTQPEIINSATINNWTVSNSNFIPITINTTNYKF